MAQVRAVVGACLVLAGFVGVGCSRHGHDQLDTAGSEHQIAADLSKTYGVPVTDARCPSKVAAKRGSSFRCTVAVGRPAQPLPVKVVQRDDKGHLLVTAQAAVVHTDQVAADISKRLNEQFNRTFLTDCGAPAIKVVAPGSRFDCQAADGTSQRVVTATVHDVHGTMTYAVGERAAAPGSAPGPSTTVPATTAPATTAPATTAPATTVPDTSTDTGQKLTPVTPVPAPTTP